MRAPAFRAAVEKQIRLRTKHRVSIPSHFPSYLVRQGVIDPDRNLADHFRFTDEHVDAAVAWLREPRLLQYKEE